MASGGVGFHASAAALDALARTVDHSARERAQRVDSGFFPIPILPPWARDSHRFEWKSARAHFRAGNLSKAMRSESGSLIARSG
jgi:hypothetical protein